jgi:hypothetical protein
MLSGALVSMLVILLIVHYTMRPIFKTSETGPGIIPVPTVQKESTGMYWLDGAMPLRSDKTVLGAADDGTYNYSITLDIVIRDPNVASLNDRPIFSRSDDAYTPAPVAAESVSVVQQIGNYNLVFYIWLLA